MSRGLYMGTPVSLAMFAALVAAITVVAAMTVVGALALLYYSSAAADPADAADDETHLHLTRDPHMLDLLPAVAPVASAPAEPPLMETELYPADSATRIHTPRIGRLLPAFDEDESSLNRDLAPYPRPNRAAWAEPGWAEGSGPRQAVRAPRRFDRTVRPQDDAPNAAFGTPEWTEEEGATEIFSAHNLGDMSEFAFVDDEVPASRR
jgi:hypothetical protein